MTRPNKEDSISDLTNKIPEAAIVAAFAGIMAISPRLYGKVVEGLAERHGLPCDESFKKYVSEVLKKQPPIELD